MKAEKKTLILTYKDINEEFTHVVGGYLRKGYTINTATFGCHGSEIAHIDVTDGHDVIRIFASEFYESIDFGCVLGIKIIAGKVPDCQKIVPHDNRRDGIIWNDKLEKITCDRYYLITSNGGRINWKFSSREAAIRAVATRFNHLSRNEECIDPRQFTSNAATALGVKFLKRQLPNNRIVKSDVGVFRQANYGRYYVLYRGKRYYLSH